MGLTIHYQLKHASRDPVVARQLVEQLRSRALDLPFQQVGPLIVLSGDSCDFRQSSANDPHRWLLIQGRQSIMRGSYHYDVSPTHLIAFNTIPGNGSEPADFGLCFYPATFQDHRGRRRRSKFSGWSWRSCCKTQYASNPDCGGIANFLRCHLLVVAMLDRARELGILGDVSDEGDYWQKRDSGALARQVGEWNQMIAAQVGQIKDLLGSGIKAEILKFSDFEHLEAAGGK
jgi:hypothetical protein